MTQDEIERLYAAGKTAEVDAALRQQATESGDYWAARSPQDAAAREFGTVPSFENLGQAADLGLAGLRGTLFYRGYQQTRDMIGLPPADPNWNPSQRWEELSKDVPMEYHQDVMETQSEEDYLRLRARVAEKQSDNQRFASNGPAGMAAMIGGSLFDVDLLLAPLSDGAYTAAKIARTLKSARAARMIGTAIETGVVSGGVTVGLEAVDDGDLDWTGVASSTLTGFVMGGAAGALISPPTRRLWTDGAQKVRDDFHARMASDLDLGEYRESIPSTVDYKQYLAQATKAKNAEPDSVGAAASPGGARTNLNTQLVNARHQAWVDLAADELAQRYGTRARAPYRGLDEALRKIEGYLGDVGLGSDWQKFAKSDSKIAQWIAARFLESPTGSGGRSGTAALDREMFQRRILQGMPEYQSSYARWAQGQNATIVDMHWKQDLAEEFGKQVHLEMNYRRLHDTESPNGHADVKRAADALEKQAKEAYDILKASGADGFDTIKYKRGYSPLRWNGHAIRNAVASGTATKNDIIELIANGYAPALGLPMEEVRVFARALYTRAVSKADDFDTSLQNLLTADGRAFLREKLVDNGITSKRADQIVESLSGPLEERGKAGFAKNRMEIDLSVQHNGLNLIDFTDNNLSRNWTLYARQASGNAALARAGIKNKAERGEIMDALTAEQVALNEAPLSREFMEDVFSYFDAGPVSGGVNPNISRLKKLTNLSLLNKLGIAQAAETGVTIAAVGWENFLAHAPAVRRFIKNGQAGNTDALLEELGAWTGRIWDEEKLINPEIDFNIDRMNTDDLGKFMNGLDRFLAKGQRLQGHLSLFYTIRSGQTKAAAAGITDKLFKVLAADVRAKNAPQVAAGWRGGKMPSWAQAGKLPSDEFSRRFSDIGFGPDMRDQLEELVRNGTIEFQPNGFIDKLNMDKWDPMLAHEFSGALTRFVHQVIQKDLIGESNVWMSKDMGALFTHLIQFPLLAMQKQAIRNTRLLDVVSKNTLLYGLTTAGLAYAAGQMIEGRTDKLDPISIAKGALSYSNMTGFLPMMWDPVATMFGVDDWRINRYGQHSELGLPVVDWVNKAMRVPGAILSATDGEIDKGDKSALKALPFANMYGSAIVFNALLGDGDPERVVKSKDVSFDTDAGTVAFDKSSKGSADWGSPNFDAKLWMQKQMEEGAAANAAQSARISDPYAKAYFDSTRGVGAN